MKRILSIIVALTVIFPTALLVSCGAVANDNSISDVVYFVEKDAAAFSNADKAVVNYADCDATITLNGVSGSISDRAGSSGNTVEITTKGVYRVTGSSENVSIVVDDDKKSGVVYLALDNVSMTHSNGACIYVKSADKLIIYAVGENSLSFSSPVAVTDPSTAQSIDSPVFSKDNLTFNGENGSKLTVSSSLKGVVVKDDLKFTGSDVSVTSVGVGLDVNDSVRIGGGDLTINSGKEGVNLKNSAGDPYFYIDGGRATIVSFLDGISVKGESSKVVLAGGSLDITAGGGSESPKNSSYSQKGVKCVGNVLVGKVGLTVSSADDCLNSNSSVFLTDGTVALSSSDDGVHADKTISVSGGDVAIEKAHEGLEALTVLISGGKTSVNASDDGVNASADLTETDGVDAGNKAFQKGKIAISGGSVHISASGSGLDSDGSVFISGGTVIVEGSETADNGALKKGKGAVASITGGTVLAIGPVDKAINFDAGTQCSALLALAGQAGTSVSVNDGSGFSFTATQDFGCVVYSSPSMKMGRSYVVTAGETSANAEFLVSYYYSDVTYPQGE